MTNEHDLYQQEVVCTCKDCGAPITRYYYANVPYCEDCRSRYNKEKFNRERAARGNKLGHIVHFPNDNYPFRFGRWSKALCGQFGYLSVFTDVWIADDGPICWKCARAFALELGIDLKSESMEG